MVEGLGVCVCMCVHVCVCVWISQAPIDKRQMDLHGSGLFRTGEKRSEGERRPAIVFLHDDCCRKQRSVPHLRFIPGPLKKVQPGFFFFLSQMLSASGNATADTHACT